MENSHTPDPIIPPMESNPDLKEYFCPHCSRFLFKGNVKKLRMVCHHCQKLVDADESDLFPSEEKEE